MLTLWVALAFGLGVLCGVLLVVVAFLFEPETD